MKLTLREVPVFSLVVIRMGIAALIMLPFISKDLKIERKDLPTFIWAAATAITIHMTLFFIGLKLSQAIYAAVLAASVPVMTLAAANIFLKEKLTARLLMATFVAIIGLTITIGKPVGNFNFPTFIGNLLLLGASAFWVIHEIIAKKLLKKYPAQTITFYTMGLGAVSLLPPALWELFKNPLWITSLSSQSIGGILFGILFASLIAHFAWQKGLSLLPAGEASFFFYIDPISGAVLAMILLGEKLTLPLIIGGALITSAVFLAENKRKNHPLHK